MNLFNKKKGNKGFTLVELLATIVILGILSSMAIAGVSVLIKKAKNSEEEANAKVIQMAAESYLQANKDNAPRSIGECTTVSVADLKNKKFLTDDITNSDSKSCMKNSYVKIFKSSNGEFIYTPYIYCGDAKETTSSKEKMVPIGEIKFSKTTDVNRASFVLNLYGDQNKTKGHYAPSTEIDGYSWSLSVMYEGDTSYTEIYNTGTLSANKAKSLEISENLADYVDISSTTKVKVDYMITNVACETYTSEMVSNGGASTGTEFEDTVPPTCGEVSGNATGENDWISNISSNKSRLVSVTCNDGDGSGCKRKSFSRSWPDKSKASGVEKAYIDIYDNRDKKFEGNSETGNKTKCLVDVNVDLETPSASLIATKTATDNNNVLKEPLKIEASTNPIASNVIHVSDYDGTTSNWMNGTDFKDGVYFIVKVKDNLHLDHYTWETNKGYQTSVNENDVSVNNPDGVASTQIPQEAKYGKTDLHGSTEYTITVGLNTEGKRYGVLTVYDKAGNAIKYEMYANIDRTAPQPATFDGKKVDDNDSKYDVYSFETANGSEWTNSRVRITSTGTGKDEIIDPIKQETILSNLSGHGQYYYDLSDVTKSEKILKQNEKIRDGGSFLVKDDGIYKIRFKDCDKAGNCSYSNWKYVKVDRTPPVCNPKLTKEGTDEDYTPATAGNDSWTNKSVRITQTCSDATSGCDTNRVINPVSITKLYEDTMERTVGAADDESGGVFYDNAGNSVTCDTYKVQIDKIAPTCSVSSSHNDWTNSDVAITATCNDLGGSNCAENNHTYTFKCEFGKVCIRTETKNGQLGAGDNGGEYTMYDVAGNSVVCPANQSAKIDKQGPTVSQPSLSNRTIIGASATDCDVEGINCVGGVMLSYAFTSSDTAPGEGDSAWGSTYWGSQSCNNRTYAYVKATDKLGNHTIVAAGNYQDDCCSSSNPYGCPWVTACRAGNTCVYKDKTRANRPGIYCDGIVAHVTSEDYMYILGYDGVHAYVFAPKYKDNAFLNYGYVYIWAKCINHSSPNSVCSYSKCPG